MQAEIRLFPILGILALLVFQGLENQTGVFSEPWKSVIGERRK